MRSASAVVGRLLVLLIAMKVFLATMEAGKRSMVKGAEVKGHANDVPALFVFGDSLLDPGNGIHLDASSKSGLPFFLVDSSHLPYGRDLPSHRPSGRYSNGLVASDILAMLFGLPYPSPYLVRRDDILKGTSFATAGAVINNLTGYFPIPRQNFYDQVNLFAEVRRQFVSTLGESNTNDLISKSIFVIWMGSNDYYLNYNENPLGRTTAQKKYNPYEFRKILISSYKDYLEILYDLGVRKFAIVSLPALGCAPVVQLLYHENNETCISFINKEAQDFNMDLLDMSKQLQSRYPSGHFTFLNTYDTSFDIMTHPSTYGFLDGIRPCCSTGPFGGVPLCSPKISTICKDASKYVFWDFAHPTEAMNFLMVKRFMTGASPNVEPYNLQELSLL